MTSFDLKENPHRRFNALTGEWVLVSPHRTERPWQGRVEDRQAEGLAYDPDCYMCPGNVRTTGARNPPYTGAFVFDNDYPSLLPNTPEGRGDEAGLLVAESERGVSRVISFSPRHDLALSTMDLPDLRRVVDVWALEYIELGARPGINYVQIFENRGIMMGCSNPHPHGQIWAESAMPNEPAKEQRTQREYEAARSGCLLCDYLALEKQKGERSVLENGHFLALVPFWAIWPFETLVISKRHATGLDELGDDQREDLADILKRLATRYDQLFATPFPYSMGFHQRPTDGEPHGEWHLHAHFYPPLLRSATVRKFMVGYEMLGSPQRDITPEAAAVRLRNVKATI